MRKMWLATDSSTCNLNIPYNKVKEIIHNMEAGNGQARD